MSAHSASRHLGKSSTGEVHATYTTPLAISPELLVPVPRVENRSNHRIDADSFVGVDVWNAYEFSALTDNGLPVVGVLKIMYDANTTYLVESKSLKLYLNSFNMVRLGATKEDVLANAAARIEADLREVLRSHTVTVEFPNHELQPLRDLMPETIDMEDFIPPVTLHSASFECVHEAPELLKLKDETLEPPTDHVYSLHTELLRSNCLITNQPDWGDVRIYMTTPTPVDVLSVLQYIVSYRSENHFHEEVCEMIYRALMVQFKPRELAVACLYTRRGGIDINPVRASSLACLNDVANGFMKLDVLSESTRRQ